MEFVQQNILWVALAVISGSLLIWSIIKAGRGDAMSPSDTVFMMNRENAVVVDIREHAEFASGHVPGARHIALEMLDKKVSDLEKFKNRPIIFYCANGKRAGEACDKLRGKDFKKVYMLEGGLAAWREAGQPVEK